MTSLELATAKTQVAALLIEDLQFAYPAQTPLISNLSLSIAQGQKVGLIGHNGSGKTTLFHLISGILYPTQGEISAFGRPIEAGQFHPDVGLVFQSPNDQLFTTSVRDDVAFGPQNMDLQPDEIEKRVQSAFAATGTSHLADRVPQNLSGGEKSMVAIAAVLAMLPRLVLYDEPSANLDLRARRRLIEFLQQSTETILLAAHDLEMIREVCDRVILLNGGQILADGHPDRVMCHQDLMEDSGLEVPYSLRGRSLS
ncbi:MAG: ABC transporter ATP-binding protein [Cyanobacteria bacterium P01_H01_bin.15]